MLLKLAVFFKECAKSVAPSAFKGVFYLKLPNEVLHFFHVELPRTFFPLGHLFGLHAEKTLSSQ